MTKRRFFALVDADNGEGALSVYSHGLRSSLTAAIQFEPRDAVWTMSETNLRALVRAALVALNTPNKPQE